jgi:hypothetical protein
MDDKNENTKCSAGQCAVLERPPSSQILTRTKQCGERASLGVTPSASYGAHVDGGPLGVDVANF